MTWRGVVSAALRASAGGYFAKRCSAKSALKDANAVYHAVCGGFSFPSLYFLPSVQLHQKHKHLGRWGLRNLIACLQFLSDHGAHGAMRRSFRVRQPIRTHSLIEGSDPSWAQLLFAPLMRLRGGSDSLFPIKKLAWFAYFTRLRFHRRTD